MTKLFAAPMLGPSLEAAYASRPLLYHVTSPTRLFEPSATPFVGADGIGIGSVTKVAGNYVFSIAPGEWFVRSAPGIAVPEWHEAMLVSSCCDSHVEWRISPDWLEAICRIYGSHAPKLDSGRAMALGIAGERMIFVLPRTGPALLYHEASLLDWFVRLLEAMRSVNDPRGPR